MAKATAEKVAQEDDGKNRKTSGPYAWLLGVAAIVVLGSMFMVGAHYGNNDYQFGRPRAFKALGHHMEQRFGHRLLNKDANVVSGKVTEVNGSEFKINDDGTIKTVKTTDETSFLGDGIDGLKVDDKVVVFGEDQDNTITATKVRTGPVPR